jgi:hypothetical protein
MWSARPFMSTFQTGIHLPRTVNIKVLYGLPTSWKYVSSSLNFVTTTFLFGFCRVFSCYWMLNECYRRYGGNLTDSFRISERE